MGKGALNPFCFKSIIGLLCLSMIGCASSASNYNKRYNKVWKELIKSQAWKEALENKNPANNAEEHNFYTSTDDKVIFNEGYRYGFTSGNLLFDKYNLLVIRAYEKIIAEAAEADGHLEKEYLHWNSNEIPNTKHDRTYKQNQAQVNKRFRAHREMLEGLTSWNIFSEYGSDDLDFFMAENKNKVYQMFQKGDDENKVVNYLVYKLADLYHFEN